MFFDARAAKLLEPGGHLLIEGCPGLRLSASASSKRWVYRYKDDTGAMRQVKLGNWPAMPAPAAIHAWAAARAQREAGADPAEQRRAERLARQARAPQAWTVADLLRAFLGRYIDVERSPASACSARSALERLLAQEPELAASEPAAVGRAQAYSLIEGRQDFPAAAGKLKSLLGQAWDWARDAGLIEPDSPNWWREVMRGRLRSKGKLIGGTHQGRVFRTLTEAELAQLLPWCMEHMHPNGRDAVILYLWTGMRGRELFGLRPEFIGKERNGWWVTYPVRLLKTAEQADTVDHRVPLVGRALEVVQRRLERVGPTGYLFETMKGGQAQHYSRSTFSSYIYHLQPDSAKARRRAGAGLVFPVGGWSAHDLRRTARTMLSRLRCDVQVAEAFIGHRPPGIVGVYDRHTFDAEKMEWAPRLAGALEALLP